MWPTRILFAWSLVTTAFAWRPIDDCPNDRLCLTSFKWCSRDQDSRGSCYYPPDVYPYTATDYAGPPAIISWGKSYNLSWVNHDPDYPITIRWYFPSGVGPESSVPVQWELNLTATPASPSYYIFEPKYDDTWFPNVTNTTAAEAKGFAADAVNIIEIHQFEAEEADAPRQGREIPSYDHFDNSDQFIVEDGYAIAAIENSVQRNNDDWNHKLKLGLGVGLGLGIPFIIVLTAGATWFCCSRRAKKAPTKS